MNPVRTRWSLVLLAPFAAGGCSAEAGWGPAETTEQTEQALASTSTSAFCWAGSTANSSTASPPYCSRNPTTVSWLGSTTGFVDFPFQVSSEAGNSQVTAYGNDNVQCAMLTAGNESPQAVHCFNPAGQAVRARFTVSFARRNTLPGPEGGYMLQVGNDPPLNTPTVPLLDRQWNSAGGNVTLTVTDVGRYVVTFPGQNFLGGTSEVSALSSTSRYCKVGGWSQAGTNQEVTVLCFTAGGAPAANTAFYLNFNRRSPVGANSYTYAWADNPTASSYTPDVTYQHGATVSSCGTENPTVTPVTIQRTSVGRYTVNFPEMPFTTDPNDAFRKSNVKVTGYGSDPDYCKVVNWNGTSTSAVANVACFNASGSPADARFTIVYLSTKVIVC